MWLDRVFPVFRLGAVNGFGERIERIGTDRRPRGRVLGGLPTDSGNGLNGLGLISTLEEER